MATDRSGTTTARRFAKHVHSKATPGEGRTRFTITHGAAFTLQWRMLIFFPVMAVSICRAIRSAAASSAESIL